MTEAPYTEINEAWRRYDPLWWVVTVQSGRIGMVKRRFRNSNAVGDQYEIQFGPDGPFQICTHNQLLLATKLQVRYMEGT